MLANVCKHCSRTMLAWCKLGLTHVFKSYTTYTNLSLRITLYRIFYSQEGGTQGEVLCPGQIIRNDYYRMRLLLYDNIGELLSYDNMVIVSNNEPSYWKWNVVC
uniref:Uncharacterized protein n=1 Tax=Cacopsylla melanoneura TaxID=428564 RepID=A0A8D8Z875_9HEMI